MGIRGKGRKKRSRGAVEGPNHSGPIGWSMPGLELRREGAQLRREHSWESLSIGEL